MRTLYEDWQVRRQRINAIAALPQFIEPAHILDFLLRRYARDPAAQNAARFPCSSELILNSRAILVHQRLQSGEFAATRTSKDAHLRARTILSRLSSLGLQADACAPGSRLSAAPPDESEVADSDFLGKAPGGFSFEDQSARFVARCKAQLQRDGTLGTPDTRQLKRLLNQSLNGGKMKAELPDILSALILCDCEDVTKHLLWHWMFQTYPDVNYALENYLRSNGRGAEMLRQNLGDDDTAVRTRAARGLSYFGSLNDIGFLQDLMVLPEMTAESDERAAYVKTMKTLAGLEDCM